MRVRYQAPPRETTLAQRLIAACELADSGRTLVEMRVRLANPSATEADIREAVRQWLASDPPDDGRVRYRRS